MDTNNQFSVTFRPTALFSLKDSNATNSGAKSLFVPSPYAIKMALLNQAITLDGVDFSGKKNENFAFVRDAEISYFVKGHFCVNNCFVKILKKKEDKRGKKAKEEGQIFTPGFQNTISFREYVYLSDDIEFIISTTTEGAAYFWKKYLYRINYFGKRGCFFQFVKYSDETSLPNISKMQNGALVPGILQELDDFSTKMVFDNVNSFSTGRVNRAKDIYQIPISRINSSKSYSHYEAQNS